MVISGAGVPGASVAAALVRSKVIDPAKLLIVDTADSLPNL